MPDGPNYEKVFTDMKVFHGGNAEDVKHIVRYLHFFKGTDAFELYAKHYLPMLAPEVAAQFVEVKEEKIAEPVSIEQKVEEKKIAVDQVAETVIDETSKKKAGRPKKIK